MIGASATAVSWMLGMGLEFGTVLGLLAVPAIFAAVAILTSRPAENGIPILATHQGQPA